MLNNRAVEPLDYIDKIDHASVRMEQGLISLLSLHTTNELSSICGNLNLETLQKGSNSMKQIMKAVRDGRNFISRESAESLLKLFWEQPILEYLRSIGHPAHAMSRTSPKDSVLAVWISGGFLTSQPPGGFTPYFIARDLKRRYLTAEPSEIRRKMDEIRMQVERAKDMERLLLSENGYSHIVRYFREVSELRMLENAFRDHLLSELDISRAEMDSSIKTSEMSLSQLIECESQCISIVDGLNLKISQSEAECGRHVKDHLKVKRDLQTLGLIINTFRDVEDVSTLRGDPSLRGGVTRAVPLLQNDAYSSDVAEIHHKVDNYRKATLDREHAMMATINKQELHIAFLLDDNKNLSDQLSVQTDLTLTANTQSISNFEALKSVGEQLVELQCLKDRAREEACSIESGLACRLEEAKKILSTTTEIIREEISSTIRSRALSSSLSVSSPTLKRSSSQTKRNSAGSRGSRRANSVLRSSVSSAVTAAVTALRPSTAVNTGLTVDHYTAITAFFRIADALEVSSSVRFMEMRERNTELEESESMGTEDWESQQRRAYLIAERRARAVQLADEAAVRAANAAAALAVETAALAASAKTDRRYGSRQKNSLSESAADSRGRIREGRRPDIQPSRDRKSSPSKLSPSRTSSSSMRKGPVMEVNNIIASAASSNNNNISDNNSSSSKGGRIRGVSAVPREGVEMRARANASASPSRAQSARNKSSPTSTSTSASLRRPTPIPTRHPL